MIQIIFCLNFPPFSHSGYMLKYISCSHFQRNPCLFGTYYGTQITSNTNGYRNKQMLYVPLSWLAEKKIKDNINLTLTLSMAYYCWGQKCLTCSRMSNNNRAMFLIKLLSILTNSLCLIESNFNYKEDISIPNWYRVGPTLPTDHFEGKMGKAFLHHLLYWAVILPFVALLLALMTLAIHLQTELVSSLTECFGTQNCHWLAVAHCSLYYFQ